MLTRNAISLKHSDLTPLTLIMSSGEQQSRGRMTIMRTIQQKLDITKLRTVASLISCSIKSILHGNPTFWGASEIYGDHVLRHHADAVWFQGML